MIFLSERVFSCTKDMSVNINLDNNVIFTVPVDDRSGFLYGIYQDAGTSEVTVDLKLLLKNASDISLTNYVYFLTHDKTRNNNNNQSVIFDQDLMVECLDIYNITGDDNYFNYLIPQLHKFWTLLSPVLYAPDFGVDDNVMWDVHLHTPHQLLPKRLVSNKLFYDNWLQLNVGKEITLNGDQVFMYKMVEGNNTVIAADYKHIDNDSVINKKVIIGNNNKTNSTTTHYNDKLQGQHIDIWHDCFVIDSLNINGKLNGPYHSRYYNGQIRDITYYLDGRKMGSEVTFDENGSPIEEIVYYNVVIKSKKYWGNNEQNRLVSETQYISGSPKEIKYFYPNGNYVITTLPTTFKNTNGSELEWAFVDGEITTSYEQNGTPIWKIVYGKPTVQYFFDKDDGKIISETIHDNYGVYDYKEQQWIPGELTEEEDL